MYMAQDRRQIVLTLP